MCGRFTNRLTWREIVALYRLTVPTTPERNMPARYNICPTTMIDAVIERDGKRELVPMRWGLIPLNWRAAEIVYDDRHQRDLRGESNA
jgi:putative SOS response-associated peptidase YedK